MFINSNRVKRRPQGSEESQSETKDTIPFDEAAPEAYLSELKALAENETKRGELTDYLTQLNSLLDSSHALQSLEVLFLMALDGSNLPKMAAEEGLLEKLDTMKTLGQLKQKRLASSTYDKLKPYVANKAALTDTTNVTGNVGLSVAKTSTPSFGRRDENAATTANVATKTAITITLYVEHMENDDNMQVIESCLLRTKGVVSFFSDVSDQRLVVRSTVTAEELVKLIYQDTHHRASTIKGSYDAAGPQYIRPKSDQEGENGWFSSLKQIITPNSIPASSAQGQGWFGTWW
eukprot:TRINITY_DN4206_c0_g1_i1.p1 TRINITY_DN4206_c0_g1~~TRINITY_DN4206_c0_g1_i1.p1  ORF type:complete len:291 (+),score=57.58 TRINITY_DN4206_c0_g1_i1:39-911(+)